MSHVKISSGIVGTSVVDVTATGTGPMYGFLALLKVEKVKGIFAVIEGGLPRSASFSFAGCLLFYSNLLFCFAVRYGLEESTI